jgi:hypothetical protein
MKRLIDPTFLLADRSREHLGIGPHRNVQPGHTGAVATQPNAVSIDQSNNAGHFGPGFR